MKKIPVNGPSVRNIMEIFSNSVITGFRLPLVNFTSALKPDVVFEVVIDKIDASIWNLTESTFRNEPELKKHLIIDGWINSEKGEKYSKTITRKCRIKIYADGSVSLQKKRK